MDKDEKNKLIYTLQSSSDPLSLKKFRLDPATGSLSTSETLDHEATHQHVLTVMVWFSTLLAAIWFLRGSICLRGFLTNYREIPTVLITY